MFKLFEDEAVLSNLNKEEVKSLRFLNSFYGITAKKEDYIKLQAFTKFVKFYQEGYNLNQISKLTRIKKSTLRNWAHKESLPYIIRLLEYSISLSKPQKGLWLSINSTRGGKFIGPWIEVPQKLRSYSDVEDLIKRLKPPDSLHFENKEILFAYLLGIMVGDASKHGINRSRRVTRRVQLRLTKRYNSNLNLGNYFSLCVRSVGLRVNRIKDCPAGKCNPLPFYAWSSQSSQFVQWIFAVCLGLKNNEVTTYNPIKADWILKASREFKIAFLQGISDSDGFVDLSAVQVGIITSPNTRFIKSLLDSLEVESKERFFTKNKLWALMLRLEDAYKLPVFNKEVNSYRYKMVEKLYGAKRVKGHWPPSLKSKIDNLINKGFKGTKLVKRILEEEDILIRCKGISRRINRSLNTEDAL